MFSSQFYEKWVSVRERKIKLLLETVTYLTRDQPCISSFPIGLVKTESDVVRSVETGLEN